MVGTPKGSAPTEVAVGGKGPDTAHADRWAITIRFEDENFGAEWRWQGRQSGAVRFLDRLKIIVPRHPRDPVRYTELSPTPFKDFWRE
jgi:hypothetical protein